MKYNRNNHKKGFTFIEVLLYMGIVSFMLTAIISFAWNIIDLGVKSRTQQEVYTTARYVSERLKYEIRNANGVNASDFDVNFVDDASRKLSLSVDGQSDPNIVTSLNNQVFLQQSSAEPVSLQSVDTKLTSLIFKDYSSADGATKYIGFTFTIESNYPESGVRQGYQESVTIESGAELRSH